MNGKQGYSSSQRSEPSRASISERVTALETEIKHLAPRAWVLGGVIAGLVLATGIILSFAQLIANLMKQIG